PGPDGFGLHSSGMFILNPPYTLEPMLREVMPYLVKVLGKDAGATFVIERGTQVTGAAAGRVGAGGTVRQPVGNARRASPLSGAGSLRLPGQPSVQRMLEEAAAAEDARRPIGAPSAKAGAPANPAAKVEAASRAKRFSRPAGEGAAPRAASGRPQATGAGGRPSATRPDGSGSARTGAGAGPARSRKPR
ncbi:MAG: rRNA ((2030)-N(6))-methyltransferase RlmJ, partial [Massilia sp.]|nr:rRNA ((2030)-N(6))-methyltransferase RlmJ [Massilia sp.]